MTPPLSLVIGGGAYGVRCARYARENGHRCLVIDPDPDCPAGRIGGGVEVIEGGIGEALEVILSGGPLHIFPTAPIHVCAALAMEWGGMAVEADGVDRLQAGIPPDLVVSFGEGSAVVSYNREGRCLPSCAVPPVCPVSGRRHEPLFQVLRESVPGAVVLESVQCAPGIGALRGRDVIDLLARSGREEQMVVGTACRCHGVVTAIGQKKGK
ncbi:NAD(P)-binding protein [Methanofollis fontis]|uniref:Uncharacterized protein n=1 Tax=Methanofollis fontis TaxID=2052832 RepID=A0A483CZG7_9EURY|nr:NAD(P)-binding protein [Methanofollis fontis]TAJ45772.1 hypothetical protein CUJ86_03425 [Methanofollis fontis]